MTSKELRLAVAHPFLALARDFGWDDRQLAAAKKLIDITVIRIEELAALPPSSPVADPIALPTKAEVEAEGFEAVPVSDDALPSPVADSPTQDQR